MGKLEFWIIFIFALILMFLASCRTQRVETSEAVDSTAMRTVTLRDSIHRTCHLDFEQMDIYYSHPTDTMTGLQECTEGSYLKHICITRGSLSDTDMRTSGSTKVQCDSMSSTKHGVRSFSPPTPNRILVLAFILILGGAVLCRGQP